MPKMDLPIMSSDCPQETYCQGVEDLGI